MRKRRTELRAWCKSLLIFASRPDILFSESEEIAQAVECKIEDETYSVSVSPTSWGSDSSTQGSPVENPIAGTALYPTSNGPSVYPRASHSERWSVPVPTLRPHARSPHSSPSSPTSSVYVKRSRTRSNNPYPTPLQIPSHRRDSDSSAVLNARYGSQHSAEPCETGSRLSWLLAGESDGSKDGHTHHSVGSFTATAQAQPSMYSPQGYHRPMSSHSYSSGWSSSGTSSLGMTSSQTSQSFSSPASLQSHSSWYAPSSGGMSSPEPLYVHRLRSELQYWQHRAIESRRLLQLSGINFGSHWESESN